MELPGRKRALSDCWMHEGEPRRCAGRAGGGGGGVGVDAIVVLGANAATRTTKLVSAARHARPGGRCWTCGLRSARTWCTRTRRGWRTWASSCRSGSSRWGGGARRARRRRVVLRERRGAGQPVQGRRGGRRRARPDLAAATATRSSHRTGHSIDSAGARHGPHIDNLETSEERLLIPGVGFSIEPGIYLRGDVGLRSEINVYMGNAGPEVTPPAPQMELPALLAPVMATDGAPGAAPADTGAARTERPGCTCTAWSGRAAGARGGGPAPRPCSACATATWRRWSAGAVRTAGARPGRADRAPADRGAGDAARLDPARAGRRGVSRAPAARALHGGPVRRAG